MSVLFSALQLAAIIEKDTEILIIIVIRYWNMFLDLSIKRKYKKLFLITNVLAGCECLMVIIHTSAYLAYKHDSFFFLFKYFKYSAFAPFFLTQIS